MEICSVCCEQVPKLFSLCSCSHKFCQDCCISHITARLDSFSAITCPQAKCQNKFNEKCEIATKLSPRLLNKLRKYKNYQKIIGNPNLRQCKFEQCEGILDISKKQKVCQLCKSEHCSKCFELKHSGKCNREDDAMMIALKFRRCPKCRVWVEKSGGCQYLNCKCGVMFCFECGVEFEIDPCRKHGYSEQQYSLKVALLELQMPPSEGIARKITYIPLLIIKIVLFILYTIITSILFIVVLICVPLIFSLISPFLCYALWLDQMNEPGSPCCNKCCLFGFILMIILYPIIVAAFCLSSVGVITSYPIGRSLCPSRIYDVFDEVGVTVSLYFLIGVSKIFNF